MIACEHSIVIIRRYVYFTMGIIFTIAHCQIWSPKKPRFDRIFQN